MTDAEARKLADEAWAEFQQVDRPWTAVSGYSPERLAKTHWGKGKAKLDMIGKNVVNPPSVPLPTATTLLWSPPTLSASKTIWNVTTSDHSRSFGDTTDVEIRLPATPLVLGAGTSASLTVIGGRNITIIGGEIRRDNVDTGGSPVVDDHYGIYLVRNCGTVHIEGVYVHGAGMAQPVILQQTRNDVHPTVQIQNCLLMAEHTVTVGIHTDGIQGIAGPDILRLYQNTIRSSGTAMQMQPYTNWTGHTFAVVGWDLRKLDWITQLPHSGTPGSYGLWKSGFPKGSAGRWPEYHEDIYYDRNTNHVDAAAPIYSANADIGSGNEGGLAAWNPGGGIWTGISGSSISLGLRASGDLVVNGRNCGTSYSSPGYA